MERSVSLDDKNWFTSNLIGGGYIKVDPGKVAAISTCPTPKTVTEVRSFLGSYQYLREFIRHFSQLAAPLHDLTKANPFFK